MIATRDNLFTLPEIVANTEHMGLTEWRQMRKAGLGGSDAAGAIGLSRYASPITVYFDKTEDGVEREDSEKMEAGRRLEPVIAEWFAEKSGKKVIRQPYMYRNLEHPWMLANVDFGIEGENAGVECKNTSFEKDWEDGLVPDEYFLQCNHYMAVTGADRWYLVYLVSGWKLRWVTIERNEDLIQTLIKQEGDFWHNYVVTRTLPAFDGSNAATELLKKMYPHEISEDHEPAEIPDDFEDLWQEENAITKQMGEMEKRKKEIRNQICSLIGERSSGMSARYIFTWTTQSRKEYMVNATSYRVLRGKMRRST